MLNGMFSGAVDDADVSKAGADQFFDNKLELGFLHNGNKVLGVGFNGGEETGGPATSGDNGFSDCHNIV